MDYNNNQNIPPGNDSYYRQPNPSFHNPGLAMAAASMFLGLGAVFTSLTVFLPLAFGGFAVLFALLSKGYGKKMIVQAKIGFICGLAGIGVTIAMLVSSIAMLLSNPDLLVEIGQQYDAVCEDVYGEPAKDMFGFSFEDMMEDYADTLRH